MGGWRQQRKGRVVAVTLVLMLVYVPHPAAADGIWTYTGQFTFPTDGTIQYSYTGDAQKTFDCDGVWTRTDTTLLGGSAYRKEFINATLGKLSIENRNSSSTRTVDYICDQPDPWYYNAPAFLGGGSCPVDYYWDLVVATTVNGLTPPFCGYTQRSCVSHTLLDTGWVRMNASVAKKTYSISYNASGLGLPFFVKFSKKNASYSNDNGLAPFTGRHFANIKEGSTTLRTYVSEDFISDTPFQTLADRMRTGAQSVDATNLSFEVGFEELFLPATNQLQSNLTEFPSGESRVWVTTVDCDFWRGKGDRVFAGVNMTASGLSAFRDTWASAMTWRVFNHTQNKSRDLADPNASAQLVQDIVNYTASQVVNEARNLSAQVNLSSRLRTAWLMQENRTLPYPFYNLNNLPSDPLNASIRELHSLANVTLNQTENQTLWNRIASLPQSLQNATAVLVYSTVNATQLVRFRLSLLTSGELEFLRNNATKLLNITFFNSTLPNGSSALEVSASDGQLFGNYTMQDEIHDMGVIAAHYMAAALDEVTNYLQGRSYELNSVSVPCASGSVYFADSNFCKVIIGGSGTTTFNYQDSIGKKTNVQLDLGGDDTYNNEAAGGSYFNTGFNDAGNVLAALSLDLGGNDTYRYEGGALDVHPVNHAQGGAALGAAILVDTDGNDTYWNNASFAFDGATYTPRAYTQGTGGVGGAGLLFDLAGNDSYAARNYAQGAAIVGAAGLLWDSEGSDRYEILVSEAGRDNEAGQATSCYAALAILFDGGGADEYQAVASDHQGAACWASRALLYDRGGNDRYSINTSLGSVATGGPQQENRLTSGFGQGFGEQTSLGTLLDEGGDDNYSIQNLSLSYLNGYPLEGKWAQGYGSGGSIGLLWDGGGNDRYEANVFSQAAGGPGGVGMLKDAKNVTPPSDDHYIANQDAHAGAWNARACACPGLAASVVPGLGLFYDFGGTDTYSLAPAADDTNWRRDDGNALVQEDWENFYTYGVDAAA